jgi:hypothetical protein
MGGHVKQCRRLSFKMFAGFVTLGVPRTRSEIWVEARSVA